LEARPSDGEMCTHIVSVLSDETAIDVVRCDCFIAADADVKDNYGQTPLQRAFH
jgi:hypothetical protein